MAGIWRVSPGLAGIARLTSHGGAAKQKLLTSNENTTSSDENKSSFPTLRSGRTYWTYYINLSQLSHQLHSKISRIKNFDSWVLPIIIIYKLNFLARTNSLHWHVIHKSSRIYLAMLAVTGGDSARILKNRIFKYHNLERKYMRR